jgi:hypothetical protein
MNIFKYFSKKFFYGGVMVWVITIFAYTTYSMDPMPGSSEDPDKQRVIEAFGYDEFGRDEEYLKEPFEENDLEESEGAYCDFIY